MSSASPLQEDEVGMKNGSIGLLPGARSTSRDIDDSESTSLESIGENPPVELRTGKRADAKAGYG